MKKIIVGFSLSIIVIILGGLVTICFFSKSKSDIKEDDYLNYYCSLELYSGTYSNTYDVEILTTKDNKVLKSSGYTYTVFSNKEEYEQVKGFTDNVFREFDDTKMGYISNRKEERDLTKNQEGEELILSVDDYIFNLKKANYSCEVYNG